MGAFLHRSLNFSYKNQLQLKGYNYLVEEGWFGFFVAFFLIIWSAVCSRRVIQLCDKAHLHAHKDVQRDSGRMGNPNYTLSGYPQTQHRSHQTTEDPSP